VRENRGVNVERARGDLEPVRSGAAEFAADVRYYLSLQPRQLPSRYLYDALGSALFEAIGHLPWYPLTRAERRLIRAYGREVFAALDGISTIVELGPGNGEKLAALLAAAGPLRQPPQVHLIDVSESALARAARLIGETASVDLSLHATTYEAGLAELAIASRLPGRTLALFFGSNIGNFDPPGCDAFLHMLRATLRPGDALLLGADLVKPAAELLLAYDDPLKVTAAFNRNLIVRINRELGGTLDPAAFDHRAIWNERASRIEMHLVSERAVRVVIPAAGLDFEMPRGGAIWTESSYKYEVDALERTLRRSAFQPARRWIDEDHRFALLLALAVP
jgi:dimethylhistidine N-methyltransferase